MIGMREPSENEKLQAPSIKNRVSVRWRYARMETYGFLWWDMVA